MTTPREVREKMAADINALAKYTAYSTHRNNIPDSKLPAAVVTTGVGIYESGAEEVSLEVRVAIHDNKPAIENVLDDYTIDFKTLFPIGSTLGGLVEYIKPESFDYILDTDSNAGVKVLIFNVKYEE